MNQILTIANKEFHDGIRNRWLISISLIFTLLAVGLSYFGGAASASSAMTSLATTIASLSSLAVFLIPLIALLLSYDSFVGEQESGTLLLLLTYPLSKSQLLLGKFIGQGSIISLATLVGFGAAAVMLYLQSGELAVLTTFGLFIISAILLGLSFTAVAFILSLIVSEKSKAAGAALITWFFFALAFDLALLALLVGVDDGLSQQGLTWLMMLNPADIFRLINLANLSTSEVNGVLTIAIDASLSVGQLFTLLGCWILLPLGLATMIFKKRHL